MLQERFFEIIKNYKALIVLGLFLIFLVCFKLFRSQKQNWNGYPKVVETEIVKKSQFKHQINLLGTIRPKNYCVLTAKTGGTIDTLIPAGSEIKKGNIIAKIENADVEKTYDLPSFLKKINSYFSKINSSFLCNSI
ncbi:MAG: hypothetical protein IJ730_06435 [Alphaproteobacteria bacterium]|nr:hypothetical protein [Alphaproteobacteria bacterium]